MWCLYVTVPCFPSLLEVPIYVACAHSWPYTQGCWTKKVILGTCAYFSGEVQGFICAWGIETLYWCGGRSAFTRGEQAHDLSSWSMFFFLQGIEHAQLILACRCGAPSSWLHLIPYGFRSQWTRKRLAVSSRKEPRVLPAAPQTMKSCTCSSCSGPWNLNWHPSPLKHQAVAILT